MKLIICPQLEHALKLAINGKLNKVLGIAGTETGQDKPASLDEG